VADKSCFKKSIYASFSIDGVKENNSYDLLMAQSLVEKNILIKPESLEEGE
jgi:hypothetical protein